MEIKTQSWAKNSLLSLHTLFLRVQSFFEQPGFGESGISVAFNPDSKISFVLFVVECFDFFFRSWREVGERRNS